MQLKDIVYLTALGVMFVLMWAGMSMDSNCYFAANQSTKAYNMCGKVYTECVTYEEMDAALERVKMYNKSIYDIVRVQGVYFDEGYYCVYTANRSDELINDTEKHELCHAMIDYAPVHFCDGEIEANGGGQD